MFKSKAAASVISADASTPKDAMKQALLAIVQVWLDRLHQQGIVTTFFCTIDSLLFSLTSDTRKPVLSEWTQRDKVINASIGGAIIFHVCASIVSYVASFVLIRYRLDDAEKKESDVLEPSTAAPTTRNQVPHPPYSAMRRKHSAQAHRPSASVTSTVGPSSALPEALTDFPLEVMNDLRGLVSVYRTHPLWFLTCCGSRPKEQQLARDLEGSSSPKADSATIALKGMVGTLSRAHTVCVWMSSAGFVLALLGILTYSWTAVPAALGIFASACMGVCAIAAVGALW